MAHSLRSLVAYDAAGNVVGTADYSVLRDDEDNVIGLVDFEAIELSGRPLTELYKPSNAVGCGTWPEWLGVGAHEFRVALGPDQRIARLVHRTSGFVRDRAAIEAAIAAVPPDADGVRDIRHLVGGPNRPLVLDDQGHTLGRSPAPVLPLP